jgi:hypothetical protein
MISRRFFLEAEDDDSRVFEWTEPRPRIRLDIRHEKLEQQPAIWRTHRG